MGFWFLDTPNCISSSNDFFYPALEGQDSSSPGIESSGSDMRGGNISMGESMEYSVQEGV